MAWNVFRSKRLRLNTCLASLGLEFPCGSASEPDDHGIRNSSSLVVENDLRGSVELPYGLHLRTSNPRSRYQPQNSLDPGIPRTSGHRAGENGLDHYTRPHRRYLEKSIEPVPTLVHFPAY